MLVLEKESFKFTVKAFYLCNKLLTKLKNNPKSSVLLKLLIPYKYLALTFVPNQHFQSFAGFSMYEQNNKIANLYFWSNVNFCFLPKSNLTVVSP